MTVAMIGELTNYTVGANGREMPFASCQLAKPFGCFQTCKVLLPPANRGGERMRGMRCVLLTR